MAEVKGTTAKEIHGTCISVGCTIDGKDPLDLQLSIHDGDGDVDVPGRGHVQKIWKMSPILICDDVLSEIVARLPYKSLVRFMAISKPLHTLISNSTFSVRLPVASTGFIYRPYMRDNMPSYFPVDGRAIDLSGSIPSRSPIACSSNGALLLERRIYGVFRYHIRNPTIRTGFALPCSRHLQSDDHIAAGILFNPHASRHYKVVEVAQESKTANAAIHFQVFSSQTGQWAKPRKWVALPDSYGAMRRSLYTLHARDVVCGGTCVYMLLRRIEPHLILVVDVEEESIRLLELPPALYRCDAFPAKGGAGLWISIGVSGGQILLFCINRKGIHVWERRGNVRWELKHCEHGRQARDILRRGRIAPRVLHVEGNEIFVWTGNQISMYDMEGRSWKVIHIEGMPNKRSPIMTPMIPYSPCLVNPFGAKPVNYSKKRKCA